MFKAFRRLLARYKLTYALLTVLLFLMLSAELYFFALLQAHANYGKVPKILGAEVDVYILLLLLTILPAAMKLTGHNRAFRDRGGTRAPHGLR